MKNRKRKRSHNAHFILNAFTIDVMPGDVLLAFLKSMGSVSLYRHYLRYGTSQKVPSQKKKDAREVKRLYNRFTTMVSRLKKEGLITAHSSPNGTQKRKILRTTKKGKQVILSRKKYNKENSDDLVMVMFDIPEKFHLERDWLRGILKELDFEMVQRSVWMGKTKIPEQFVEDMRDRKIVDYIEIIKIKTPGTIETSKTKSNLLH